MPRLIDADALYSELAKANSFGELTAKKAIRRLANAPTVDAEPARHGKWRFVNCATGLRCQCSECLHWVDAGTDKNYCPNCGADMRGEE